MNREGIVALAGGTILASEYFGSYQGDWLARTTVGWLRDGYGSCSGCDWIEDMESERLDPWCPMHYGKPDLDCEECLPCVRSAAKWDAHVRDVYYEAGVRMLEDAITSEDMYAAVSEHADWDWSVKDMQEFIRENW